MAILNIPIVDISSRRSEQEIGDELIQAASTSGFVYIKNLGEDIPVEAIDGTFNVSKKFFATPVKEKKPFAIQTNNKGWSGMHTETLDAAKQRVGDFKEAFNVGEFKDGKASQELPPVLKAEESTLATFSDSCYQLSLKILRLFAVGLKIDTSKGGSTWFSSRHSRDIGPSGTILRVLYYPSIPADADYQPDVDVRAGAHSDYGSITLLFQRPGQPGLEILTPESTWEPVPVMPPGTENDPSPPILVNIGDLLSYWTNGLLKSTVHRVIFPKDAQKGGEDRYSIAYFCHPMETTPLEPVPSPMISDSSDLKGEDGKLMTANEHLQSRLRATYLALYQEQKA